jgi:hypothetical protein
MIPGWRSRYRGWATGWRSGVRISTGRRDISLYRKIQTSSWGPRGFLFNGPRGSFTEIKRPGRDVDHSHLSRGLGMSGAKSPISFVPSEHRQGHV